MAHWAELDDNNTVIRVLVGDNNDPGGDDGYAWIVSNLGGTWIKTSYNGKIRKNFAGVGFKYDESRDAFIPPKPFDSWTLDENLCKWIPPVKMPWSNQYLYVWNEEIKNWEVALDEEGNLIILQKMYIEGHSDKKLPPSNIIPFEDLDKDK